MSSKHLLTLFAFLGLATSALSGAAHDDFAYAGGIESEVFDSIEPASILDSYLLREFQSKPEPGFSQFGDTTRIVPLDDGEGTDVLRTVFRPAQGTTLDEYTFSYTNNNTLVLLDDGVNFIDNSTEVVGGVTVVNMTIEVDFRAYPGVTDFVLDATHADPANSFSQPFTYIAVGIVFYESTQPSIRPTVEQLISGPNGVGVRTTYPDVLNYVDGTFQPDIFAVAGWDDGCTTLVRSCTDRHVAELNSMNITVRDGALYNWDTPLETSPGCEVLAGDFIPASNTVTLPDNCPTAFAADYTNFLPYGIAFKPYKVGATSMGYIIDIGDGSTSFNTLNIRVEDGDGRVDVGPPVVTAIFPDQNYRVDGGQLLTVEGYNFAGGSQFTFTLQPESINPIILTFIQGSLVYDNATDTYTTLFETVPGTGKNLPVEFISAFAQSRGVQTVYLVDPPFLFDYAAAPLLTAVTPDQAVEGDTVVLSGTFETFNSTRYPDTVLFNGNRVSGLVITAFSDSSISIIVPPRPQANTYIYPLSVQVATLISNSINFEYLAPPIIVDVEGTFTELREDAEGLYWYTVTGQANNPVFIPTLDGNINGITYEWRNVGAPNTQPRTTPTYLLNLELVPSGVFTTITLTVTNDQGASDTFQRRIIKNNTGESIGGSTSQPVGRTRSTPPTPLRISSSVNLEGTNLPANPVFTFSWRYLGTTYTQFDLEDQPTLTLLGRTFVIPNCFLEPGNTTVTFNADVPSLELSASNTVLVVVNRANLIAKINGGIVRETINFNANTVLSGAESVDPDVLFQCPECSGFTSRLVCQRQFIQYNWSNCVKDTDANFQANPQDCSEDIFSAGTTNMNLPVDQSSLQASRIFLQVGGSQIPLTTYVQIALTITSTNTQFGPDDREAVGVYVMVLPQADTDAPSPASVSFSNVAGREIDPAVVKNWEVLIISVATTSSATWDYRINAPVDQQNLLEDRNNLVSGSSYWVPGVTGQSAALGVTNENPETGTFVLTGATQYAFLIDGYRVGNSEENNIELEFTTIENPTLVFPAMQTITGDENTNYVATARSTVTLADFIVQFKLQDITPGRQEDNRTFVSCLGECAGVNTVSFRIIVPGRYQVTGELWDTTGVYQFDSVPNSQVIDVSTSLTNQELIVFYDNAYIACANSGDSGCLTYLNEALPALSSYTQNNGRMAVSPELEISVHQNFGAILPIQLNSISTRVNQNQNNFDTAQTESFISQLLASASDSFAPSYTSALLNQGLGNLVNILENQVDRDQGNQFTNVLVQLMPRYEDIARNTGSPGTSRRRLLQNEVNNDLLDVEAVMVDVMPNAIIQSIACGSAARTISTQPAVAANVVRTTAKKMCNTQDLQTLLTDLTSFTSCNAGPLGMSNQNPKVMYVIQTGDYVNEAGITAAGQINTRAIANTGFSDFLGFDGRSAVTSGCYDISLAYDQDLVNDDTTYKGFLLENQKVFNGTDCTATSCYIAEEINNVQPQTTIRRINIEGQQVGLYSGFLDDGTVVVPTPAPDVTPTPEAPVDRDSGLSGGAIAGIVIGALFGLLIAVILLWLIITRCCITPIAPPPGGGDEPFEYVERDVYGRGFVIESSQMSETSSAVGGLSSRISSRLGFGSKAGGKTPMAPQTKF